MARPLRLRPLVGRLALVLVALLLGAVGIEGYGRARHLDRLQARGIAVDGRRTAASNFGAAPLDWGLPYLPRVFTLDDQQLTTAWGTCRFDHPGRTVLVLGDSTTRQASGAIFGGPDTILQDEARRTWAGLLQRGVPKDVQVCVVAEDGYHPSDYVALVEQLGPLLQPDLIVVLLCSNDMSDIAEREAVARDGWQVVYELPTTRPVYPPLWQPWLYDHSEAFRFLHYRLATATGDRFDIPVAEVRRPSADSLRRLGGTASTLLLAYLPALADEHEFEPIAQAKLERLGMDVVRVELSGPWRPLRRQQDDVVHLSDQGHSEVAAQLTPAILQALDGSP